MLKYGAITADLVHEPVEVAMLVDGGQVSGPFVANHNRRGMAVADEGQRMCLTADESLALLAWLQEHESELRAMVQEEVDAVALVMQTPVGRSVEVGV